MRLMNFCLAKDDCSCDWYICITLMELELLRNEPDCIAVINLNNDDELGKPNLEVNPINFNERLKRDHTIPDDNQELTSQNMNQIFSLHLPKILH